MSRFFYPLEACLENATERKTALAAMVVHLYQVGTGPFVPDGSTTLAELTTNTATYDGYATQTVAAWLTPILAPGTGYQIVMPTLQFDYVDGVGHVSNIIGGAYFVDAGGVLRGILALDPGEYLTFAVNGQGWPITGVSLFFPTGYTPPA